MEAAAKKFEQEEEIFQEIENAMNDADDLSPLSDMLSISEEDGYYPYCEIDFGLPETQGATQDESSELEQSSLSQVPFNSGREYYRTEMSDASLSCAASTLCSFLKPVDGSSMPNVRFSSLTSICCLSTVLLFYSLAFL